MLDGIRRRFRQLLRQHPVLPLAHGAIEANLERGRRRHLPDVAVERRLARRDRFDPACTQKRRRLTPVRRERRPRRDAERLDLRSEEQRVAVAPVVEWLDAKPIPRSEHDAAAQVVDQERPHSVELPDALATPLLVRAQQNLGIPTRTESVAERNELAAKLDVVVYLAVEDHHELPIVADERLMTRLRQVENAQSAEAEGNVGAGVKARVIRSTVREDVGHPPNRTSVGSGAVEPDYRSKTAHVLWSRVKAGVPYPVVHSEPTPRIRRFRRAASAARLEKNVPLHGS